MLCLETWTKTSLQYALNPKQNKLNLILWIIETTGNFEQKRTDMNAVF